MLFRSLPTIVLIDGKGVIRHVWHGWSDEIDDQLSAAVDTLVQAGTKKGG